MKSKVAAGKRRGEPESAPSSLSKVFFFLIRQCQKCGKTLLILMQAARAVGVMPVGPFGWSPRRPPKIVPTVGVNYLEQRAGEGEGEGEGVGRVRGRERVSQRAGER